jgi:uncharacterized protein (DUF2252 family)
MGERSAPADRPDPVAVLEEQSADRLPQLVPVRYGRMISSPFAFYRGSANLMADDIAGSPSPGIEVQVCGDAHLANFGVFATPERKVVFDLNDFDETLRAPFELDVKRLAASFVLAGRHRGFDPDVGRNAVRTMTGAYQPRMRSFAEMGVLDVWYSNLDADEILRSMTGDHRRRLGKVLAKARTKDHLQAQSKLTEVVDGRRRIKDDPPLVVNLAGTVDRELAMQTFEDYSRTLTEDRKQLVSRYRLVDVAQKVVGVGSVGTHCLIVLFEGRDDGDPLFLQVKEANASVLEGHFPESAYENHAERVVQGQRVMQAASDIFLGWIRGRGDEHRDFYWRQLRDVKGSADLEAIRADALVWFGEQCGAALARAHARTGDAAMISGYIGTGPAFPRAMEQFGETYADQAERDHAALVEAVRAGRVKASTDEGGSSSASGPS